MPRVIAGRFSPEEQFELAFQGSEIAHVLIDLRNVLSRKLTDPLARRPTVACELQ